MSFFNHKHSAQEEGNMLDAGSSMHVSGFMHGA